MPIEPGSVVTVLGLMSTAGKSGPSKTSICIDWRGSDAPMKLRMLADVRPFFIVETGTLRLGTVRPGEERSQSVELQTRLQRRVMLREKEGLPAGVRVTLTPLDPDRFGRAAAWKATVRVSGDEFQGPDVFWLRLESDEFIDPRAKRVFVATIAVDLRAERPSKRSEEIGLSASVPTEF